MRFVKLISLLVVSIIILAGCSDEEESIAIKVYEHLEQAVTLEEEFAEQQQPLVDLEQQEKELYDQIINLGLKEFDQVQELSEQALSLVEERETIVQVEKESIDAAKEEFDKIEPLIDDIEDEELNKTAKDLYDTMQERYQAYYGFYDLYIESISLDKQLYEMLQQEEVTEEEIKEQIEKVNQSYDKVIESNNNFNTNTNEYNDLKQNFYNLAEFEIEYE